MILSTFALLLAVINSSTEVSVKNCQKLKPEEINKAENDKCDEMTADCFDQFDVTGIKLKCWSKVKLNNIENLTPRTAVQILKGNSSEIPREEGFVKLVCKKADDQIPASFIKSATEKPELGKVVFKALESEPSILKHFFNEDSVKGFNLEICPMINKSVISLISDKTAFKHVKSNCLAKIDAAAFEGFQDELWRNLNPEALSSIKRSQLEKLPDTAAQRTTKEQAERLGVKPGWFSKADESHPCFAAVNWHLTDKDAEKALKDRCEKIWGSKSSSIKRDSSITHILFSIVIGWVIVLA